MAESTGNVQPQLDLSEHDETGNVPTKRSLLYGWNPDGLSKARLTVNEFGYLSTPYAYKKTVVGAITYIGRAPVGTAESAAAWQAFKIDETSGMRMTWADGDSKYDNVVTDLTALTYS